MSQNMASAIYNDLNLPYHVYMQSGNGMGFRYLADGRRVETISETWGTPLFRAAARGIPLHGHGNEFRTAHVAKRHPHTLRLPQRLLLPTDGTIRLVLCLNAQQPVFIVRIVMSISIALGEGIQHAHRLPRLCLTQ